ncbi:MAG: hypothetical protein K2W80_13790 [Burkholderiales bacterium]|nr:hypothetical protein [Burkholderiales bacterium]
MPVDFPANPASAPPAPGAVSWGAVLAGAAGAAALALILTLLGLGLGFSVVSPWANQGASATTLGLSAIAWLTLTQLFASALGGYLAGRLRTRWLQLHPDEVHFRDSAHGFLAWAVATLATAALLTSAIASIAGGTGAAGSLLPGIRGDSEGAGDAGTDYLLDALFRPATDAPAVDATAAVQRPPVTEREVREVRRIIMNTALSGELPQPDRRHLGRMIAERTGITPEQAEARAGAIHASIQTRLREAAAAAREAADRARKASAKTTLWMFISLLVGAFVATLAGIYGGRQRDD